MTYIAGIITGLLIFISLILIEIYFKKRTGKMIVEKIKQKVESKQGAILEHSEEDIIGKIISKE